MLVHIRIFLYFCLMFMSHRERSCGSPTRSRRSYSSCSRTSTLPRATGASRASWLRKVRQQAPARRGAARSLVVHAVFSGVFSGFTITGIASLQSRGGARRNPLDQEPGRYAKFNMPPRAERREAFGEWHQGWVGCILREPAREAGLGIWSSLS